MAQKIQARIKEYKPGKYYSWRPKKKVKASTPSEGKRKTYFSIACTRCGLDHSTSFGGSAVCIKDRTFYVGSIQPGWVSG